MKLIVICVFGLFALASHRAIATNAALPGTISLDGHQLQARAKRYGGYDFAYNFTLTKQNSAPFLPKITSRYEDKPRTALDCGVNGTQFYVRHDALPFAKSSSGAYYVVRSVPYGTEGSALSASLCKRLSEVWSENKTLQLPLQFISDFWQYDAKQKKLVSQNGGNNLFINAAALRSALSESR